MQRQNKWVKWNIKQTSHGQRPVNIFKTYCCTIPCTEKSVFNMKVESVQAQRLNEHYHFLIDEVTQCPKQILELIDNFLRYVTRNYDLPFEGKIIVLSGDFRQRQPVISHASPVQILQSTSKASYLWDTISQNTFHLTHNQRSNNTKFS